MSDPRCQSWGMIKRNQTPETTPNRPQLIMEFGQAQLLASPEGKLVLKGGTAGDRTEAKEYISLFLHEAVVSFTE